MFIHFLQLDLKSYTFTLFVRSITQWKSFQDETDEVIRQMNEVEKRMTEFTTAKANSEQEAEDKLCLYQVCDYAVLSLPNS